MAAPTYEDLGAFTGRTVEATQGAAVLSVVSAMARAYTRGVGWDGTEPNAEIAAVVLSAASRLLVKSPNPQAVTYEVHGPDSFRHEGAPLAFSVAELIALNRYRVRAL